MKKSDRRSENVGGFKVMDKDRRQQEQDEIWTRTIGIEDIYGQ
jgi:hypothetical protein